MGIINVTGMEMVTDYRLRTQKGDIEVMRGFREKLMKGDVISHNFHDHEVIKAETEKRGDAVYQRVVVRRINE